MFIKLGYDKNIPLEFNNRRSCGLWLIIIGAVIIAATFMGGSFLLKPVILCFGYFIGFYIAIANKKVRSKLSQGSMSLFQKRMSSLSIMALFVLIMICTSPFWTDLNWRMIWPGCFSAVSIHFFLFYFIHGKAMTGLGLSCLLCAISGMILTGVPFIYFGVADGLIKLGFGVLLLFIAKPTKLYARTE